MKWKAETSQNVISRGFFFDLDLRVEEKEKQGKGGGKEAHLVHLDSHSCSGLPFLPSRCPGRRVSVEKKVGKKGKERKVVSVSSK